MAISYFVVDLSFRFVITIISWKCLGFILCIVTMSTLNFLCIIRQSLTCLTGTKTSFGHLSLSVNHLSHIYKEESTRIR